MSAVLQAGSAVIDTTDDLSDAGSAINLIAYDSMEIRKTDESGRRWQFDGTSWHPLDAGLGTGDDITPS